MGCTLILKLGDLTGNAIAISKTLALTALHGKGELGDSVTLHTWIGIKLSCTVVFLFVQSKFGRYLCGSAYYF